MMTSFTKMHGAGNDFVMVDNRNQAWKPSTALIAKICSRHLGIGADGLILLEPADQQHWRMVYFNADGSRAEMCGNGARCFARFAKDVGAVSESSMTFLTDAGWHDAVYREDGSIQINLPNPKEDRGTLYLEGIGGNSLPVNSINTGVPHAVLDVADIPEMTIPSGSEKVSIQPSSLENTDIRLLGAWIRYHASFQPKGTNVNFISRIGPSSLKVRTYERGVEDETLACGTGVTACALVAAQKWNMPSPVRLQVRSGDWLEVSFRIRDNGSFDQVTLAGPAVTVFTGEWDPALLEAGIEHAIS